MRIKCSSHLIRSLVLALVVLGVLAALAGVAAALNGTGSTYIPQVGISVPDSKLAAVQHAIPDNPSPESTTEATPPPVVLDTIPAHMLPSDCPVPLPPSVIQVENDWLVSDGNTLVAVYAGADGQDATKGRVVIIRQDLQKGSQTQDILDVPGSGSLSIVDAPAGTSVETSAQTGSLQFRGNDGTTTTINLGNDAMTSSSSTP